MLLLKAALLNYVRTHKARGSILSSTGKIAGYVLTLGDTKLNLPDEKKLYYYSWFFIG